MSLPRIIAIETSGRSGSVAVAEGDVLLEEAPFATDHEHARDLIPLIDRLVQNQGWARGSIAECHLSIGPGSFTGLRVAVTFARHLALACGAKICAVPTLDVIARNVLDLTVRPHDIAVLLDAKGGRVFGATYELSNNDYRRTTGPVLIEPARLLTTARVRPAVLGEGIPYHEKAMAESGVTVLGKEHWRPRAANVHRIGFGMSQSRLYTPANELVPLYVRRPEAEEIWEKRQAAAPPAG